MANCIVVLLGLPGAGKTTLATKLVGAMASVTITVKVFSYDDIVPLKQQAEFVTSEDMRLTRKMLYDSVDEFIATSRECVAIVDDNNYYRSMRYEYYQLAVKHKTGFCQIFVNCEIERALKNNQRRVPSLRVPERVIRRMEKRLEVPREPWENCLDVTIEAREVDLETLVRFIEKSRENPLLAAEAREAAEREREASRQVCSASLIHHADQILRKQIQSVMSENLERAKPLAVKLNQAKKTILQKIKHQEIILTDDGIENELIHLLRDISGI